MSNYYNGNADYRKQTVEPVGNFHLIMITACYGSSQIESNLPDIAYFVICRDIYEGTPKLFFNIYVMPILSISGNDLTLKYAVRPGLNSL